MDRIAKTPRPPYYAVVFTSQRASVEQHEYETMAARMAQLAAEQPGCLGAESVRDGTGLGITVSYWESLEAIRAWKQNEEHLAAQEQGRRVWYEQYRLRICKVERDYGTPPLPAS